MNTEVVTAETTTPAGSTCTPTAGSKEKRNRKRRAPADRIPSARRFGSEEDVELLTGIKRKTLQKHRVVGKGFPFYRAGGRVLYDLDEIDRQIRAGRVSPSPHAAA